MKQTATHERSAVRLIRYTRKDGKAARSKVRLINTVPLGPRRADSGEYGIPVTTKSPQRTGSDNPLGHTGPRKRRLERDYILSSNEVHSLKRC